MREARIKVPPALGEAVYHCTTRTVNGEYLIDEVAKEALRQQLWKVAEYCGVTIGTYAILTNHFHVLVCVPQQQEVSDAELLRRYRLLHPKPTKYQSERLEVIEAELAQNGPEAARWRKRQLALMGDLSPFMKLLKQRFSIWYNKAHNRFGTLWAERFKSSLIETHENVLQIIAAYIDLNSVRAGLVTDPKEYRFCGYSEAVAGNKTAQAGISSVVGLDNWGEVHAHYREVLFGTGGAAREGAASIPERDFQRVIAEGGKLPLADLLRCRIRHFTDGAVLGRQAFVTLQLAIYRKKTGLRERMSPRGLPPWTDWGDLTTLRGLRKREQGSAASKSESGR